MTWKPKYKVYAFDCNGTKFTCYFDTKEECHQWAENYGLEIIIIKREFDDEN